MTYSWRKGGQSGGGYCNAIATDPYTSSVIACGDVWGFARSDDAGRSWYPTNEGQTPGAPYGRCAAFSQKHPGRAYVGVGTLKYQNPSGGGYLGMIDPALGSPYMLARANTTISFTSYLPTGGAGDVPRPCGRLIAVDYDQVSGIEYLYLLTRQGLMRSTDGGMTVTPLGLPAPAPLYAWSAVCLLATGDLLISSFRTSPTGGSRLWKVSQPRTSAAVSEVTGIHGLPPVIEDIASVLISGTHVYLLACGPYGLIRYNGTPLLPADAELHLSSVTQDAAGVLWTGNGVGADDHRCVARSMDGGQSWQWATPAAACLPTIYGTQRRWWLADAWSAMSKGSGYSVSQLAVGGTGIVYSAGRAGVHSTHDAGQTWAPTCDGLDGSEANAFTSDGATVWASDTDYHSSASQDGFANATQDSQPPAFPAPSLTRGNVKVTTTNPPQILVNGVDQADDYARSALTNPKDVYADAQGRIYIALSGGVLVGDPT